MPIIQRTPAACYQRLVDALGPLVASTITSEPLLCLQRDKDDLERTLEFRAGEAVPIETKHGRLYFYMGQTLRATPEENKFRLRTWQYWYRVQEAPLGRALIRWEYEKETPRDRHARNHVQVQAVARTQGSGADLNLNKLHTPTGWTTVEEVIRFLIWDLGVSPPCGDGWPEHLSRSERAFYEEFTGKRYDASTCRDADNATDNTEKSGTGTKIR